MYKDLYPSLDRIVTPASYPKTKLKHLPDGRTCTVDDIADFVVDYIQNDHIGLIAHQSLVIADQCGDLMMRHPDCLRLAELATQAVDFAKSGYPANLMEMPRLHYSQKPDWSAGEILRSNQGNLYQSTHALGVLYRLIDLPASNTSPHHPYDLETEEVNDLIDSLNRFSLQDLKNPLHSMDEISLHVKSEAILWIPLTPDTDTAETVILPQFRTFALQLQYICANCSLFSRRPLSEEECWAGTIVAKSSQPRARQDMQARLREQCNLLVTAVRAELGISEAEELEDWLHRAWMAWLVSRSLGNTFGARSYGYIALGSMFEALKELEERGNISAEW